MFKRLRQKWKLSSVRFGLVLLAFALGGSLCGWVTRQLLELSGLDQYFFRWPAYLILLTLTWPFCVLVTGHLLGQGLFFRNYLRSVWLRLSGRTRKNKHRLAIFASGGGSNARAIMDYFAHHPFIKICLVVCNRPGAGVTELARERGIPVLMIEKEPFLQGDAYTAALLHEYGITHLVLAGFLWKVPARLIQAFPDQIINIHPALLPAHGGMGMYGRHVHMAVLASGDAESGITIHLVDQHYDHGQPLFQARCAVLADDTPQTLAERVLQLEHTYYAPVIEAWITNKKRGSKNTAPLLNIK